MTPSSNPRSSRSGGEASPRAPVWRASLDYRPGLLGEYPGQECILTLPGTRVTMTLCWCPDSMTVPGFWIAKHLVSQELDPTSLPLLHVMHGPNGSGKTSLAEAFEFAVTRRSTRLRSED